MNPAVPSTKQFAHDAFYTMTASLQAAAIEIGLCWAYSNGYLFMRHRSLSEAPLTYILLGPFHLRRSSSRSNRVLRATWALLFLPTYVDRSNRSDLDAARFK